MRLPTSEVHRTSEVARRVAVSRELDLSRGILALREELLRGLPRGSRSESKGGT